ncbi:MAG: hypothetical protein NC489_35425, partial [Ruminococcus flavefaciens]|nr:hypothetical protein [Ruminococcus flavefaciens]
SPDNFGDKHVAAAGAASFSSLSPDKFTVNSADGVITTNAEGSGDLKVTVDGKEKVFTVTVTEALKGVSLKIDKNEKGSMTNAVNNPAKVKVNVVDQNGKDYNSDASCNVLTYELISGNADMITSTTGTGIVSKFTVTAGTEVSIVGAKAGTAVYKVSSNKSEIPYTTVSVVIAAANDKVDHYAFTGIKAEMNKNDAYDGDANTTSNTAVVKFVAVNADGFEVDAAQVPAGTITGTAISVTKPDGSQAVVKTLTDSDVTLVVDVNAGEFTSEGTYTLVATKGGATLATATFTVKDTGVKPSVTLKKTSETIGSLSEIIALQALFEIGDSYVLTGVKFTSQNTSLIANASTGTTSITGIKSTSGDTSVELYNFTAVVSKSGRTYEVNVGTFTVTGVKTV